MGRDEFVPKIKPGSNAISGEIIVSIVFFLYDRLEQANQGNATVNKISHKESTFEKTLLGMHKNLRVKKGGNIPSHAVKIPYPLNANETLSSG